MCIMLFKVLKFKLQLIMKKTRSDRKEEKTCAGNNHESERKTTTKINS